MRPFRWMTLLAGGAVHHVARRQGVGTRLVETAKTYAQSERFASVEGSWVPADARASAFWQSQGFGQYLVRGRWNALPENNA